MKTQEKPALRAQFNALPGTVLSCLATASVLHLVLPQPSPSHCHWFQRTFGVQEGRAAWHRVVCKAVGSRRIIMASHYSQAHPAGRRLSSTGLPTRCGLLERHFAPPSSPLSEPLPTEALSFQYRTRHHSPPGSIIVMSPMFPRIGSPLQPTTENPDLPS